eukprot:scaffold14981_cov90-Cylindrotheca_fusiformis.AAC.4
MYDTADTEAEIRKVAFTGIRLHWLVRSLEYEASRRFRFSQSLARSIPPVEIPISDSKPFERNRWELAFSKGPSSIDINEDQEPEQEREDRKATIIKHLIQASDVSHSMQHCHKNREWMEGRAGSDPSKH